MTTRKAASGPAKPGEDLAAVMLAEARAEVAVADQKSSLTLTALGVGFGALFGGLLSGSWKPSHLDGAGQWLWWVGAAAAIVAVGCAALAVWPRYTRADVSGGIYYWGHVATFSDFDAFHEAIHAQRGVNVQRTHHQLWRLSRLVHRKYTLVRAALAAAGTAVSLLLVASLTGGL